MHQRKRNYQAPNPFDVAKAVQRIIADRYDIKTNCIESSFLFERTWYHLGMNPKMGPMGIASRVVASCQVFSPQLARRIEDGEKVENLKGLMGQPGFWSISAGVPQKPDDFVGRSEPSLNRFVGHVVCVIDISSNGNEEFAFVDPSTQQFHRPEREIVVNEPISVWPCKDRESLITSNAHGVVFQYFFHPAVPVPEAKTKKMLERLSIGLAKSLA